MYFKVNYKMHLICIAIAYLMVLPLNDMLNSAVDGYIVSGFFDYPTSWPIVNIYAFLMVLMVPISVVHELLHGIMYGFFGGKPVFGFKLIYAYTMETTGIKLSRNKFAAVLAAPLVVISLLTAFSSLWIIKFVFVLNILGASGDIYMLGIVAALTKDCLIVDRKDGFEVFA